MNQERGKSRRAARRELIRLGLSKAGAGRVLDAARAQGELMSLTPLGFVRVEHKDGAYTITR